MSATPGPSTLGGLYRLLLDAFRAAGLPTPELDARWLAAEAAGVAPQDVLLRPHAVLAAEAVERGETARRRRLAGEPVDRILGTREFWGLAFGLSAGTLSPRPDTETLVEAALGLLPAGRPLSILDLGTGTGAILLALLHERPLANGVGLDRSEDAAWRAARNAAALGLAGRAAFLVSDWARALGPLARFDLVVSNPPYIPRGAIAGLQPEVRDHDPHLALSGGEDGLDAYRAIAREAPRLLAPGGALILELGIGQEAAAAALVAQAGLRVEGPARRDLGGVARALVAFGA